MWFGQPTFCGMCEAGNARRGGAGVETGTRHRRAENGLSRMSDAAHGHDGHEDLPRGLAKALRLAEEQEERMRNPTERDKLRFRVMAASTPEEMEEARKAMSDWVEAHPEDWYLFGRLGGDMRMREAIREQGQERRSAWGPHEWEREALVEKGKLARRLPSRSPGRGRP